MKIINLLSVFLRSYTLKNYLCNDNSHVVYISLKLSFCQLNSAPRNWATSGRFRKSNFFLQYDIIVLNQ